VFFTIKMETLRTSWTLFKTILSAEDLFMYYVYKHICAFSAEKNGFEPEPEPLFHLSTFTNQIETYAYIVVYNYFYLLPISINIMLTNILYQYMYVIVMYIHSQKSSVLDLD